MKMLSKVFLEITNRCNLRCEFCHGTSRAPRSISEEEFEIITDRLTGHAEYLYFHVLGEPLVHEKLPAFIKRAKEKGFRPMLTTNGTLLPKRRDELIDAGLYKISISLHAPEANGAFATDGYLDGCIGYAMESAGSGTVTVFRLWNMNGADSGNARILDKLHKSFPGEWSSNRSGFRLGRNIYLEYGQKFDWPDIGADEISGDLFCYGLRDQIGILADGTVVPCCLDADGVCALGNLLESSLDDILSSERARRIYDGFTNHKAAEPLCRRCGYAALTNRYRGSK